MKRLNYLFLMMAFALFGQVNVASADGIVLNFEGDAVGKTYPTIEWGSGDITATVENRPGAGQTGKALHVINHQWDSYPVFYIELPAGKTLDDVEKITFELYYESVEPSGDQIPNDSKNFNYFFGAPGTSFTPNEPTGGVKVIGGASENPEKTWLSKELKLNIKDGSLLSLEKFDFGFGLGINDAGNYFLDNITLVFRDGERGDGVELFLDGQNLLLKEFVDFPDDTPIEIILTIASTTTEPGWGVGTITPIDWSNEMPVFSAQEVTPTGADNFYSFTAGQFKEWAKKDGVYITAGWGGQGLAINVYNGATVKSIIAYPTPTVYTLTFDPDGGSVSPTFKEVTDGVAGTLPTPTRTGYTFGGWFTDKNGVGTQYITISIVSDDVDLYAKWTPAVYNITYMDGGTHSNPASYTYGVGATLTSASKTGHIFGGWFDNANFNGTAVTTIPTDATGAKTFWAKWTVENYTLTLDAQGGTVSPGIINANFGVAIGPLPTPTLGGYSFGGWYSGIDGGGTLYTTTSTLTGNATAYAKWIAGQTVELTLDAQGGSVDTESLTVGKDAPIGNLPEPTRTGYTFGGWFSGTNGSGTEYTAASTLAADATAYAKWTANTYNIAYNADGGTHSNPATYTYGVGATLANASKTGHIFGGWFDNANFNGSAVTSIPADAIGAKTFWAKWTAETYSVSYNADGGTHSSPASYTYGVGVTLTAATKTGYIFNGWFDNANFDGSAVTAIPANATGATTFWAKWTVETYSITYFNLVLGTHSSPASYTYGIGATLTPATRTGYVFDGWFDNIEFSGAAVTTIPADATGTKRFWAKWTVKTNTPVVSSETVQIYPNPATGGNFNVKLSSKEATVITIVNLQGQTVYSAMVNDGFASINAGLEAGVYIVSIQLENGLKTQKLVVK
jgi:uncharacterized repeat protein (TIGR02543 family)